MNKPLPLKVNYYSFLNITVSPCHENKPYSIICSFIGYSLHLFFLNWRNCLFPSLAVTTWFSLPWQGIHYASRVCKQLYKKWSTT